MRFELIRTRLPRRQRWRWRIVANNGPSACPLRGVQRPRRRRAGAIEIVRDHARTAPTRSTP